MVSKKPAKLPQPPGKKDLAVTFHQNCCLWLQLMHDSMKKTLVLGATPNPDRYAHRATLRLAQYGHEVVPVGIKEGKIGRFDILTGQPFIDDVDTVTLYVGTDRLEPYYDYILSLKPKRIIFNPGTENDELMELAEKQGIEIVEGCTLVMLSIGAY